MNIKIDPLTGEEYDADIWYRKNGLWHNIEAENKFYEKLEKRFIAKCEKRNKARIESGKKPRSVTSMRRSAQRYQAWLNEDSGRTFGEFLKHP